MTKKREHKKRKLRYLFKIRPWKTCQFFYKLTKVLLIIFKYALIFLVVVLISGKILLSMINPSDYKGYISDLVAQESGLDLDIGGEIEWDLISPTPNLIFNNISIKGTSELFNAKKVKVKISLFDLLSREISFSNFDIFSGQFFVDKESLLQMQNIETEKEDIILPQKKERSFIEKIFNIEKANFSFENVLIHDFEIIDGDKFVKIDLVSLKNANLESHIKGIITFEESPIKINLKSLNSKMLVDKIIEGDAFPVDGSIVLKDSKIDLLVKIQDVFGNFKILGNVGFISNDINSLLSIFNIKFVNLAPMNLKSDFIYSKGYFKLSKMKFIVGNSDLSGEIEGEIKNNIPNFRANLKSELFDISKIFKIDYKKSTYSTESSSDKLFIDIEFYESFFNSFNIDAELDFKILKPYKHMPINNIKSSLTLNDGELVIKPFKANFAEGAVDMVLIANLDEKTGLNAALDLQALNINTGNIVDYYGYFNQVIGGSAEANIVLRSKGKNLSEVMANLNGSVKAKTNNKMDIHGLDIGFLNNDLVGATLKAGANVIEKVADGKKNKKGVITEVYCSAVNLNIVDGKTYSDRGLAIESKDLNIVVDGKIDFKEETMDISLLPVKRSGLDLSITLKPLDLIAIKGSLNSPQIVVDESSLTREAGEIAFISLVLAPLTGATSLVATGLTTVVTRTLLDEVGKDKKPCMTAWSGVGNEKAPEIVEKENVIFKGRLLKTAIDSGKILKQKTEDALNKVKNEVKNSI